MMTIIIIIYYYYYVLSNFIVYKSFCIWLCIDDMSQSYTPEHTNWKEMETENFRTRRDKNGNGFMDKEEVRLWMFPPSADPARNEAKHLFYHADLDKVSSNMRTAHICLLVTSMVLHASILFVCVCFF